MEWILNLVFSFAASYFFAILFDSPKRAFLPSGIVGTAGWMTSKILIDLFDFHQVYGYFFGSMVLGLMCQLMARLVEEPSTLFMIPGIIPFVPGGLAYDATLKLMLNRINEPLSIMFQITLLSGAIAAGLLFADYLFKIIKWRQV